MSSFLGCLFLFVSLRGSLLSCLMCFPFVIKLIIIFLDKACDYVSLLMNVKAWHVNASVLPNG